MIRALCLLAVLLLAGCATKLPANTLEQGRSCILGVVPPSQVDQVQVWAESAQVGDMLMNLWCDAREIESALNEVRRLTR